MPTSESAGPRTVGETLTGRALTRRVVLAMIKRRAAAAGLPPSTCCHTFRATGNGVPLERRDPRARAADRRARVAPRRRSSTTGQRTTVTVDEIERIVILNGSGAPQNIEDAGQFLTAAPHRSRRKPAMTQSNSPTMSAVGARAGSAPALDMFALRDSVVDKYKLFATSFTTIHAPTTSASKLRPSTPSSATGPDVGVLAANGVVDPGCADISRANAEPLSLYKHQEQAVAPAAKDETFVVTTGTGSRNTFARHNRTGKRERAEAGCRRAPIQALQLSQQPGPLHRIDQENALMHNDEPTLLDSLDRGALIAEVGNAVAQCTPPQVFGVHGDWGLGKTSFLHQVQWYLTGACPQQSDDARKALAGRTNSAHYERLIRSVWFDAWRYQHEDAPVVALLQEMHAQLSWGHQIAKAAKRSVETSVRGALLSIEELTKKIGFQYSKFRDANREWEVKNLATSLPSHVLREHLSKAIDQLLPKAPKTGARPRLAVFIDDVDRCEPDAAYRLLEGMKAYLTLDNCVFIIGMNQKAVEDAIGRRMDVAVGAPTSLGVTSDRLGESPLQLEHQRTSRAAAYMEKICQNVWRLPAVKSPSQVLHHLLETTVEREHVRSCIKQAVEEYQCLPPNPRRLKGLANLIGRLSSRFPQEVAPVAEEGLLEARLLVVVAYIYQFHPELYTRWEAEPSLYDRILDRPPVRRTSRDSSSHCAR